MIERTMLDTVASGPVFSAKARRRSSMSESTSSSSFRGFSNVFRLIFTVLFYAIIHHESGIDKLKQLVYNRCMKLPPTIADRVYELVRDPNAMDMVEALALTKFRLEQLLERAEAGESGQAFKKLDQLVKQLKRLYDTGAPIDDIIIDMELVLEGAIDDVKTWAEINQQMGLWMKLRDSEVKFQEKTGQMITMLEAMGLLRNVVQVIISVLNQAAILYDWDIAQIDVVTKRLSDELSQLATNRTVKSVISQSPPRQLARTS